MIMACYLIKTQGNTGKTLSMVIIEHLVNVREVIARQVIVGAGHALLLAMVEEEKVTIETPVKIGEMIIEGGDRDTTSQRADQCT